MGFASRPRGGVAFSAGVLLVGAVQCCAEAVPPSAGILT